jgi:D-alanine-D-alanine ligase
MARRLRVGVLFGGRSGEHEISLRSAQTVVAALDPAKHDAIPVGIDKQGRWRTGRELLAVLERAERELVTLPPLGVEVTLLIDPTAPALLPTAGGARIPIDVAFPILHGTFGEDGAVQGLFEMAGVPYVGAGVLGSAAGMDKATTKALLAHAGVPVCRWLTVRAGRETTAAVRGRIEAQLGFPCFVKPANLGSSVGISKVHHAGELEAALAEAAHYDSSIIVEQAIDGRELECAVLGNERPETSVVGELIPSKEWYDYEDKYVGTGTRTVIPADLAPAVADEARALAVRVFEIVGCSGLARVDFFLERGSGRLYVNEINTMPGCTPASMFPKMWEATGLSFAAVVERLLALAHERHAERTRRRYTFSLPG